ncbi:DBF4-type zinc finger-containing protein 2 [Camelus dromedarius]|uniref:DBF4-type zinc finger-containing protein 2 n=1 Tax=Camelus dromedarius TaxID=9838 RepID=A0A5N4E5X4_CAMDR|nr:DBF4-type zinc finger-containing protein 2 [Camelus dromedarius]KAB1278851.1 DBF4-type zinc finger-containing protein 2 [Camelus dromedarius]
MQNRQGYCSYCRVCYSNLEQHMSSDRHRYLTIQSRQWKGSRTLMERFLQDVLRHHPYRYQKSRSMQKKSLPMNTAAPSEVVPNNDFTPEEMAVDADGVRGEMPTKDSKPVEDMYSRSSKSQEYIQGVSVRPSVIQKVEKGQQQSLEFVHKIGNNMKEFNSVGIGHSTNNRQSVIRFSVISNAPVSCLPESSHERPVTTNTTTLLPLGAHFDSVGECDPNKVDKYLKQLDGDSGNLTLSCYPETSSGSCQKPKESNRESLCINSDKLVIQEDVKSQGKTLSAGFEAHEFVGTEGSLKLESLSKLAVNPAINMNKTDIPVNKGIFEDGIPKHHEEFFPNMDCTQEGKHLAFLEQKTSVSSEMKLAGGSLQSASDHPEEDVPDLWKEEQIDQEDKNYELRSSEMSFDGSSSFYSLTDQSKETANEINLSEEVHADLQYKNNESSVSEISSDCDGSLHLITNQTQVIVKDISAQKAVHIRLVDESYESSDSEMTFDSNASLQSSDDYPQQSDKEANLLKRAHTGLVDMIYGSSSSEISTDSVFSLESVVDQLPVAVTERKLQKFHNGLVDMNYGSSSSEISTNSVFSLESVVDQLPVAVTERKLQKKVHIGLLDMNYGSSSSEISTDSVFSLESVVDQLPVAVTERKLQKFHNGLVDMNYGSSSSEISTDSVFSLESVVDQLPVAVTERKLQKKVHIGLLDMNYGSSSSEISTDSVFSLESVVDQLPVAVTERKLQKVHSGLVDTNYGSSSSEISTDSVFSLESVVDQLPVAVTERKLQKKVHIGLVDKNYGSSCSETSFDSDISLQSVVDHPQLAVRERNLVDRLVYLKDKNRKPSSAKAHLDCDVFLETVTDEPQRAIEEINLKEKNDLMDMSYESYGSEMSFHTDAQLVPDQSQVAVKEVNIQEVAVDLESKSVISSVPGLSFGSHASLYRSGNDQPQGALSEINLKELNIDMEVKRYRCSSSELTFDSNSPLTSVTEYSELDVEEVRKKHINLEDESFESISSRITLDSDTPLHLGPDQPELADKETVIQKEGYVHLGGKDDEPTTSKISLDSYIPFHPVINPPEEAVKNLLNFQKEEWVPVENRENKPNGSELSFDYGIFHSVTGHSEDPIKERSLQKEENVHLENKNNVPSVSEGSSKSDTSFQLVANHPDVAIKEINLQKEEHANLAENGNELSISETSWNSGIRLQSVIYKPEMVVKKLWLQKEKHAQLKAKCAEFSGSETNLDSDIPHCSIIEPQIAVKEINVQKEECVGLENTSNKYSSSDTISDSDVPPRSLTEKPQVTVLKEDHVDPEVESTRPGNFEINLGVNAPLHSVLDQPQLALLKEKHVDLGDKNSDSGGGKEGFNSDHLHSLPGQFWKVIRKTNPWKEDDMGLKNKVNEPNVSKLIHNSDVSLQSVSDQPEVGVKQINLENEGHVYSEDKNSRSSGSEMRLDSEFMVQSTVDHPQITILEQEHSELEDKHNQSCGSEISVDSVDPLQSVPDQLRETVKEKSLCKDQVDMEDKRDKSQHFEIVYDSDVLFQSVAGQTREVVKEINLWKEHVDLEDKVVKPSDSKINFDSDAPLQSVTNKIQEAVTEINLREGQVCLDAKSYEPRDSEIIFVSNAPLQSMVEQPHVLEEQQANLEDKSSDPCDPDINFVSDETFQSVADHLPKSVKEIGLWQEDHVYLEDKKYKLGDFEVSYDSDVHFVAGHSPEAVKEISLQEKNDSGVHLCLEVGQSQVVCKEMNLQKKEHLGMEEKTSEPSDSDIMCDSDVSFQIVINEPQESVNLVTGDNDCEVISDSDVPFQPVIDSPQMTVEEISCINAESFVLESESCDSCDTELGYVCEASSQSVTHHSKKTFKIVNQKKDYIILEESSCEPYGSGVSFPVDASHQSTTYQSLGPEKKKAKYIDPKDKSCQSNSLKRKFEWEDTCQPLVHQLQKVDKGVSLWKDVENTGLKDKNYESNVSAKGCNESPELVIHQVADKENLLKLKCADLESMSCDPCGSGMNFQCDPSRQSNTDQPQKAINKTGLLKKVSFDLKETNYNCHSSSVPGVDSIGNLEKAKEVTEDDPDEQVPEGVPQTPASLVGKTWSQTMREGDMNTNALAKEFKEDSFRCYVDDRETRKIKKKKLNKGKKIAWADLEQDTTSIQVVSDCDDGAGGISDIDDFPVALDKPSHFLSTKRHCEQTWRVASRCQAVKVSHGTQTNLSSNPGMKRRMTGQEKDSPGRKRLLLQNDRKTRKNVKIGTAEFPESCSTVLKSLQPNALVYVLSSNIKQKKGEPNNFSKMRHCSRNNWDINIQYRDKQSSYNYYDPLNKRIVIDPSLNIEVPNSDRNNCVEIHFSDLNSRGGDDDTYVQSSASAPFMTVTVGHEVMSHQEASEPSVFLEESEILNSSEVPKESNFQSTLLNCDVTNISPKSVRNKFSESKKKIQRKKVTTNNKPGFPQKGCRPIIPQQKTSIASEKQSIWSQTKLSDIIKKYILKYSVFLRHKYWSKNTLIRMHNKKKKSHVSRLKKAKNPAEMLPNSVPSAGAEEQSGAPASSSPKQPVQDSPGPAGSTNNGIKRSPRRNQRKPSRPVRVYDLRSLYSQVPYTDRMSTRLSHKFQDNKVN